MSCNGFFFLKNWPKTSRDEAKEHVQVILWGQEIGQAQQACCLSYGWHLAWKTGVKLSDTIPIVYFEDYGAYVAELSTQQLNK